MFEFKSFETYLKKEFTVNVNFFSLGYKLSKKLI